MPKVAIRKHQDGSGGETRFFWCPGCNILHATDHTWSFNGDLERPTFQPSILCNASFPESRCHSYVTDGRIQFLADCHHALKGQTVELPDVPAWVV